MTRRRAFTLIELLVSVAVITLLIALLLPALGKARIAARTTVCLANQRSMVTAWTLYANDFSDRAMPLAYFSNADIGSGEQRFWFGTHGTATTPPDHAQGFLTPYLDSTLSPRSVFECPAQPWGTYRPQGPFAAENLLGRGWPTSTYGYNGYYLSPEKTPGWSGAIGHRPWRRVFEIRHPGTLFVFADAMLPTSTLRNCALLDPPELFTAAGWIANASPTTAFRHAGAAATAAADGSVRVHRASPEWLVSDRMKIGSVGLNPAVHYVPDAAEWCPP